MAAEKELSTLLTLPDVPLLRVLSHLKEAEHLVAAGRASPRLGELTRANASVWRGKDVEFHDKDVMGLLRVVPPLDTLKTTWTVDPGASKKKWSLRLPTRSVHGVPEYPRYKGIVELSVWSSARTKACLASLIWELAPRLRHLEVSQLGLGLFLHYLRDARHLESLRVSGGDTHKQGSPCTCNAEPWPQQEVAAVAGLLPRLRAVSVSGVHSERDVEVLRLLLLAHRDLERLSVLASRAQSLVVAVVAALRRMHGLEDVRIDLRSKASLNCPVYWSLMVNDLAVALARQPRLRSLVLLADPRKLSLEVFREAHPAALELLVVAGDAVFCACCTYVLEREEPPDLTELVSVLQDLVRQATSPLHVVYGEMQFYCWECSQYFVENVRWRMFARHSEAETDCQLCGEAAAVAKAAVDDHKNGIKWSHRFRTIQVV
ncbi:hypothetical protein FOCC_FOCC003933 [Frankliniella occidentalis]|nr:hypothetical protein FOCC_FOCC003933 [Frankliniella occidentalis]